jgi:hypothetical protein
MYCKWLFTMYYVYSIGVCSMCMVCGVRDVRCVCNTGVYVCVYVLGTVRGFQL